MKLPQLIPFCIALCLPQFLYAQGVSNHELSASYGVESGTDMIRGFSEGHSRPNLDHSSYNVATANSGNIFITYRYLVSKRIDLGVTLGTEFVSFDHNSNPEGRPPVLLGKYKANITTLAFEFKPVYYNGKLIQLYGLVGLGLRYYTEKLVSGIQLAPYEDLNNFPTVFFNSQWTPIGIRVGQTFSGFAELGLGYKGLINGGISYRIGKIAPRKETGKI